MIYVTSSKCKLKTLAVLKPKTEDYWAVLDCNTLKRSSSQPRWQSDWAETVFTVKVFKMMVGFWCCLVAWQDQMTARYTITLARKGKCTAGPECCFSVAEGSEITSLMWKVVCVNCQHKAVTISRSDPLEQGAVPPVSFSMLYIS